MIVLNFLHSPSGGGLQNSASFLSVLANSKIEKTQLLCVVFEGSLLEDLCVTHGFMYYSVKANLLSKFFFEFRARRIIKRGDIVFSIFGPPFPFTSNHSLNIGGMAISNVFYPEIDFWGYLSKFSKLLKIFKDRYRVYRYKQLDFWIFETELLASKARDNFKFPADRVAVIKMATSSLVNKSRTLNQSHFLPKTSCKYILMLCGAHPNKQHHLLPILAHQLKSRFINDIRFVFTTASNAYLESVNARITELDVSEFFINVGPISADKVADLISEVDFLMNISVLESFSNNFVEAWEMQKPLITTRKDWSVAAAKDAALYVDIDDSGIEVDSFLQALQSDHTIVVANGVEMLKSHPTAIQKNQLYLDAIERVRILGSLPEAIRKEITLK